MNRALFAVLFGGLVLTPMAKLVAQNYSYDYGQGVGWDVNRNISVDTLKDRLSLTPDQTQRMRTAIADRQDAVRPLYEQLRMGMDKLNSQVRNNAGDADIQATLDQLDETHRAIQDANERFLSDTASFLTPTQQAKLRLELRTTVPRVPVMRPHERTTPEKPYMRPQGVPDRQIQEPGGVPGSEPER